MNAQGRSSTTQRVANAPCDDMREPIMLVVAHEFDVSHARIHAAAMAARMGFSREAAYRLAITVSELGNNLLMHARNGGVVSLTPLQHDGRQGIELVVEDDGPGIVNIDLAMTDGFTTRHGLGSGLPGSRRLMDEFAIESVLGRGTRVVARLWQ